MSASIFDAYKSNFVAKQSDEMSLGEYLELCKTDKMAYATAAERMLSAIGEPELMDSRKDERLSRIYSNRMVSVYPAFSEFYGMEETIQKVVGFFKHAAQGLEERKQILYLLGPVGSAKSSLAERLKELMEKHPIYVLKCGDQISPVFETPLGLFDPVVWGTQIEEAYGIPRRYLNGRLSPWAVKRLNEDLKGDISKFKVQRIYPSRLKNIAITKTEPGDENNQDISTLVGKVDVRQMADFAQDDPDCYRFSGGLCRAGQGILEFVEMFKAPIKVLHPLLTATQEGNYNGTEAITGIPFNGIVLAHSNVAEWTKFRNDPNNEAFIDRVYVVKVKYCLQKTEEAKIYDKLLRESSLIGPNVKCAPKTLDILAQLCVLSRLKEAPNNSSIYAKMRVYDGENVKEKDAHAKTLIEYKTHAMENPPEEGMSGLSTRWAFKILSKVFNYDSDEIGANPVHLFRVIRDAISEPEIPEATKEMLSEHMDYLEAEYHEYIGHAIQIAYLVSYAEYGQNLFDRYLTMAENWIEENDFRDPDSGEMYNKEALNRELEALEKPSGIYSPRDFRNEVTRFAYRHRAKNDGKNPEWTSYEMLRKVIEKKILSNTEDLLPVISFGSKSSEEDAKKHKDFVNRMMENGYSQKQIRIVVDWYTKWSKSN